MIDSTDAAFACVYASRSNRCRAREASLQAGVALGLGRVSPQIVAEEQPLHELSCRFADVIVTQPDVQVERLLRHPRDERELVETVFTMHRAVETDVDFPIRRWQCKGCAWTKA